MQESQRAAAQRHEGGQIRPLRIRGHHMAYSVLQCEVLFECTCPVWIVCGRICAHVHAVRIHRGHAQPLQLSRKAVEDAASRVAALRRPSNAGLQSSLVDLDIAVHAGDIREEEIHPSLHRPKKPGRKPQEVYAFHHGAMVLVNQNGTVHEAVFLGFDDDNTNNAVVIVKNSPGDVSVEKIGYQNVVLEGCLLQMNRVSYAIRH